jgi:hypothetical protein
MAIHSEIRHDDDTPREIGFLTAADGGTVGMLALVLPWLLGGLHPGREDFTRAILVSLLVGLFGTSTVLLSVFDIIRLEAAAGVGSK